jgi:lipid-binding SYLF domain-containing protein
MRYVLLSTLAVVAVMMTGCENKAANSTSSQADLQQRAQAAVQQMANTNSKVQDALNSAYAYAIFPDVGQGAVGVGGASGQGVVYRNGQAVGTAKLDQGSIGAQIGGQTYSELVVFKDEDAYNRFVNGNLTFGAQASATVIKAGAAAEAPFENGAAVYILPKGGLEAGASINGQKFTYHAWQ